ncbi:hypothetical protein [uncultured Hyphomicrobium sp.]|uniref:hypothetical protein n=1 Tax=uncultured Hyphomicrobium sp. TaxID=194373 RepID=UPI0025D42DA3|nr:hypothetical protein [uncultured Hyphomicrobium sp.]
MSGIHTPPPASGSDTTIADVGGRGGLIASVLSAVALGFSGLSFYESVLKTASLEVYVPPVIHYARAQGGDVELFAVPITIVNSGARTGTALTMELTVENLRADAPVKTKRYYSAYIGEHSPKDDEPNRTFAPLSLAGRETFSDTVQFYPEGNPLPALIDDAGDFRFTLKLTTALPAHPGWLDGVLRKDIPAISFDRTLPWFSEQQLGMRRITIPMHEKNWKPTTAPAPQ